MVKKRCAKGRLSHDAAIQCKLPLWYETARDRKQLREKLLDLNNRLIGVQNTYRQRLPSETDYHLFDYQVRMALIREGFRFDEKGIEIPPKDYRLKRDPPPPYIKEYLREAIRVTLLDGTKSSQRLTLMKYAQNLVHLYEEEAPKVLRDTFKMSLNKPYVPTVVRFSISISEVDGVLINGKQFYRARASRAIFIIRKLLEAHANNKVNVPASELGRTPDEQVASYISRLRKELKSKCRKYLLWQIGLDDVMQYTSGGYRLNPATVNQSIIKVPEDISQHEPMHFG